MNNLGFKFIVKASIALFSAGIAVFLGKKANEDAQSYNNEKNKNGK